MRSILAATLLLTVTMAASAQGIHAVGPKKCKACHANEYGIWQASAHALGYVGFHKSDKAKDILETVGGKGSAKKNWSCTLCHYTLVVKRKGQRPRAKAGVSCESCHGDASEWLDIHAELHEWKTSDREPPEHKRNRLAESAAAGMIHSGMLYDIAKSCMLCHGLAREDLKVGKLAKMLAAGHPLKPEFELVAYSQGSVRHRFYPPDFRENREMTPAELSRLVVVGAAAKLVAATRAADRSDEPRYVEAQKNRSGSARRVLDRLKSVPEVSRLLSDPTDENARAAIAAVKGRDLSSAVGDLIAPKSEYK